MQHPVLKGADRLQTIAVDALPDATSQRRVGVRAKVEPVMAVDALQEQLDLDALEIGAVPVDRLLGDRDQIAGRRRRGHDGLARRCWRRGGAQPYRYNHTRISDRSCSGSTGLVM